MKFTTAEARATARKCCELYTNRGNETEKKQAVEKFIKYVKGPYAEMTEEEKKDALYFFEHWE